jgi:hypothetical protein
MTTMPKHLTSILVSCTALFLLALCAPAGAYVYWSDTGPGFSGGGTTIGRATLDGAGVVDPLVTDASNPGALASSGGYLYWTDSGLAAIKRRPLDGSGPVQAFPAALSGVPHSLVIAPGPAADPSDTYIYYVDGGANLVYLHGANFGSGGYTYVGGHLGAVALYGDSLILGTTDGVIESVPRSGGGANPIFTLPEPGALLTSLTVSDGYVYWTALAPGGGVIGRTLLANPTPSNTIDDLVPQVQFPVAVAVEGNQLYWDDDNVNTPEIGRATITGGGVTDIVPSFIKAPGGPGGLVVDGGVDSTATALTCAPGTVTIGSASTCTVTVTDSGSSVAPGGTVSFTSSGVALFSVNGTCTLTKVSAISSACSVADLPVSTGAMTVTATYGGDAGHGSSSAGATVCACGAAPTGSAPGSGSATPGAGPGTPVGATPPVGVGMAATHTAAANGAPTCRVPRLTGRTLRQARALLRKSTCRLGRVTVTRSRGHAAAAAKVVAQGVRAGRTVRRGTNVTLRVSPA